MTHIALLRAVNVGGHGVVRMEDVRAAFSAAGCRDVRSYIQSGNLLFTAPTARTAQLLQRVRRELRDLLGAEPGIVFRTVRELDQAVRAAPFGPVRGDSRVGRYVVFLAEQPDVRPAFPLRLPRERLEAVAMTVRDVFVVGRRKPNGYYGFPNAFIERVFGIVATTRSWATVTKLLAVAQAPAD